MLTLQELSKRYPPHAPNDERDQQWLAALRKRRAVTALNAAIRALGT